MNHGGLGPACSQIVTLSHVDQNGLMGHHKRSRESLPLGVPFGKGIHDAHEIGPRIAEEVLDSPSGQQIEKGLSDVLVRLRRAFRMSGFWLIP